MATIANLVVGVRGDTSGLSSSMRDAIKIAQRGVEAMAQVASRTPLLDADRARRDAERAVQAIERTLKRGFQTEMTDAREALFQGIINRAEFQRRAALAGRDFNEGVTRGIRSLADTGRLSTELHTRLVGQYKEAGLRAGAALSEGVAQGARTASVMSGLQSRIGSTSVAVLFGIESLVRGVQTGESGIRAALRSIAVLAATTMGPQGIFVAALVTAADAAVEHFGRIGREAAEARKKFTEEMAAMVNAGEFGELTKKAREKWTGTPFSGFTDGIVGLTAQHTKLLADIKKRQAEHPEDVRTDAKTGIQTFVGKLAEMAADAVTVATNLRTAREEFEQIKAQITSLRNSPLPDLGLPGVTTSAKSPDAPNREVRDLAAEGKRLADLWALLRDRHQGTFDVLSRMLTVYDQIAAKLRRMKDPLSDGALRLQQALKDLAASDAIKLLREGGLAEALRPSLTPNLQPSPLMRIAERRELPVTTRSPGALQFDAITAPIREVFTSIGAQMQGLLVSSFGPVALVMRAMEPALRVLQPLLDAFVAPVAAVVQVVAAGLEPTLRLLFPIVRAFGIALAFLSEIVYRIAAAIAQFIGNLIKGIGQLLALIPFLGGLGRSIQRAGDSVLGFASGMRDAADKMRETRKQLESMQFGTTADAVTGLGDAARNATEQLLNVPTGTRVNLERFLATDPAGGRSGTPPGASNVDASQQTTIIIEHLEAKGTSPEEILEYIQQRSRAASMARFGTTTRSGEMIGSISVGRNSPR